jgi:hypothetical protein
VLTAGNSFNLSPGNGAGSPVGIPLPAGVLSDLRVALSVAPGSGESVTFTLFINNGAATITCTISDTNDSCSDLVNTETLLGGERILLQATTSAGAVDTKVGFSLGFTQ